jgi:hypothetical protein
MEAAGCLGAERWEALMAGRGMGDGEAVILFAGRLSPRIKVLGTGGGEVDPSCGDGAATPAAAADGYSVAAGDGSDG